MFYFQDQQMDSPAKEKNHFSACSIEISRFQLIEYFRVHLVGLVDQLVQPAPKMVEIVDNSSVRCSFRQLFLYWSVLATAPESLATTVTRGCCYPKLIMDEMVSPKRKQPQSKSCSLRCGILIFTPCDWSSGAMSQT